MSDFFEAASELRAKNGDFSLLAAQIRAARGLLGISQADLAAHVRVSRSTVADLEAAKRLPHEGTLYVLISELRAAGVTFTAMGVELAEYPPKGLANRPKP